VSHLALDDEAGEGAQRVGGGAEGGEGGGGGGGRLAGEPLGLVQAEELGVGRLVEAEVGADRLADLPSSPITSRTSSTIWKATPTWSP
jgi:hypothetical protein